SINLVLLVEVICVRGSPVSIQRCANILFSIAVLFRISRYTGLYPPERNIETGLVVRFAPKADKVGDTTPGPLSANSRHEQVQQNYRAVSEAMCPSRSKRRYPRPLGRQLHAPTSPYAI